MAVTRVALRLPYTGPLDGAALLDHFARRAVPGIERVLDGGYMRRLALPHGPGVVAEALCRALLDLDHDPGPVRELLGEDPLLGPAVAAAPGRRVPGAADP